MPGDTFGMAESITFHPTAEDADIRAVLIADGTSPAQALRHALALAARQKHQAGLRADAVQLAANPEYQAEVRAIREELDDLHAR